MEFQPAGDKKDYTQFVWELNVFKGGVPNPEEIAPERLLKDGGPLKFKGLVPDVENLDQLHQSIIDFCSQKLKTEKGNIVSLFPIVNGEFETRTRRAWFHVTVKDEIYTVFAGKIQNPNC